MLDLRWRQLMHLARYAHQQVVPSWLDLTLDDLARAERAIDWWLEAEARAVRT